MPKPLPLLLVFPRVNRFYSVFYSVDIPFFQNQNKRNFVGFIWEKCPPGFAYLRKEDRSGHMIRVYVSINGLNLMPITMALINYFIYLLLVL